MSLSRVCRFFCACFFGSGLLCAQTVPEANPGADDAAAKLADDLKAADLAVLKKHKATLESLEKDRAAAGDFAGALRVKKAWEAFLSKEFPELQPSATASPSGSAVPKAADARKEIELPLVGSNVSALGNAQFERLGNRLVLRSRGSGLRWASQSVEVGEYEVQLTYAIESEIQQQVLDPKTGGVAYVIPKWGGDVAFHEGTALRTSTPLSVTVSPLVQGATTKRASISMGTISISRNRVDLVLEATALATGHNEYGGACAVLGVKLIPSQKADVFVGGSNPSEPADVAALRAKHNAATGSLNSTWLSLLQDLAKSSAQSGDVEPEIQNELARMEAVMGIFKAPIPAVAAAATPASVPLTPSAPPTEADHRPNVVLSALARLDVTMGGEMRIASGGGYVEKLKPKGTKIAFKLNDGKVAPGLYRVKLATRMVEKCGGVYTVRIGTSSISGTITTANSLDGRGGSYQPEGTILIPPGLAYLEMVVDDLAYRDGSLCDLKALELIPAKAPPNPTP